jgi:hypothetical protein
MPADLREAIEVHHGIITSILTEAHRNGEPGLVTVTRGLDGKVLVVIGVDAERPMPRLMLDLSPAAKRALIVALEETT